MKSSQGYRNARFSCTHGSKQKEYLLWKRELLSAGGLKTWYSEFINTTNPHTGKKALMCRIESAVSPILTVLLGQMYPKSEGFQSGVLDDLNELHLAIIFMDDGGKVVNRTAGTTIKGKRYSYQCEPYISGFRIALQSHGETGVAQFRDWLWSRFAVEARVFRQNGSPIIGICKNSAKARFRDVIQPNIHPSMAYKIDGTFECHTRHRERLSERAPVKGDATV